MLPVTLRFIFTQKKMAATSNQEWHQALIAAIVGKLASSSAAAAATPTAPILNYNERVNYKLIHQMFTTIRYPFMPLSVEWSQAVRLNLLRTASDKSLSPLSKIWEFGTDIVGGAIRQTVAPLMIPGDLLIYKEHTAAAAAGEQLCFCSNCVEEERNIFKEILASTGGHLLPALQVIREVNRVLPLRAGTHDWDRYIDNVRRGYHVFFQERSYAEIIGDDDHWNS